MEENRNASMKSSADSYKTAHRCWSLNEIVSLIAANLVTDDAKASAVALASCSKSLEQPALGEVWRSLSGLTPLVQCFPSKIWGVREKKLYFKRAPLQAEWTRFQRQYASKVRYLQVQLPDYRISLGFKLDALQLLQQYSPGRPLLPNLVSLNWNSDAIHFPFMSLFMSPSLTSIYILFVLQEADLMLPLILNKLSPLSHIRDLTIRRYSDDLCDPSIEEAFSQLLMQCNHLRTCAFDLPMSAAALEHIIQLPSLEELCLRNSFQLPHILPTVVFPSLRELDVEWIRGRGDLLNLLSESPVLTNIKIECPGIERFMEKFQLVMTECGMHERIRAIRMDSPDEVKVTSQMIACNFPFKNLTTLTLFSESICSDFCKTVDLTDDDIDLLTNAMPCLKNLAVGSSPPCGVPSQITFKSLYTISHRCTRLTNLMIHFNPASFVAKVGTNESWDVALGLSGRETRALPSNLCSVGTLWVGNIPLPTQSNASCVMALGLLGVFPHLKTIEYEYENGDWKEVEDLLGVFQRMSCFPFGKGYGPH